FICQPASGPKPAAVQKPSTSPRSRPASASASATTSAWISNGCRPGALRRGDSHTPTIATSPDGNATPGVVLERGAVVVVEGLARREARDHDEERRHQADEAETGEADQKLEHGVPSSGTLLMMFSCSKSKVGPSPSCSARPRASSARACSRRLGA